MGAFDFIDPQTAALRGLLLQLDGYRDSNPDRAHVTTLQHSLLTATRLRGADADDQLVGLGLLHDVLHQLAPANHGEVLGAILQDRLTLGRQLVLRTHSVWQHDAIHGTSRRMAYRSAPWWRDAELLAWADSGAFDPAAPCDSLKLLWPYAERIVTP